MSLSRGNRWCWLFGWVAVCLATSCEGESPCWHTASCPPERPEAGAENDSSVNTTDGSESGRENDPFDAGPSEVTEDTDTSSVESEDPQESDDFDPTSVSILPVLPPASSTTEQDAGAQEAELSADEDAGLDSEPDAALAGNSDEGEASASAPGCGCQGNETCVENGDGSECVHACAANNGGCDPLSECNNTSQGAECGACPSGYLGDGTTGCLPTLLGLELSHGSLVSEIDLGLDVYDLDVPVFIQSVTLTPTFPSGASGTIRGASIASGASWTSPALDFGPNTFTLAVEQTGQPSMTYTLRVTRGADTAAYIKASNTGFGDRMGVSVALSEDGNTLAVGAPDESSSATGVGGPEDDDSATASGAVYVFVRGTSGWSQQAYIKASDAQAGDNFGLAVALSSNGSTLVVGAPGESSDATGTAATGQNDEDAPDSGAAYVFTRSGTGWSQQAYLKASNADAEDGFGASVAVSGDGSTLAIGAFGEDGSTAGTLGNGQATNDAENSGAAYVFARSGSGWLQQAYLKASNVDAGDGFAVVALSGDGNLLAVGAAREDSSATGVSASSRNDDDAPDAGAVYLFERTGSRWSQQAHVKASNTGPSDLFGFSLALSKDGSTLAVSASAEGSAASGTAGAGQDDDDAFGAGAVYVLTYSESSWSQQAYLKASNPGEGDQFGGRVSISADGQTIAVGAALEGSAARGVAGVDEDNEDAYASGAAYVFSRTESGWIQQAYVKASNTDELDQYGAVALSGDGNTLAVGATGEDSTATGTSGIGQDNNDSHMAGAVYVYE